MMLSSGKSAAQLLKTAISASLRDNIQRMSAALAYYTIFSLAPLLIISIARVLLGTKAAQGGILAAIQQLIGPEGARAIQAMIVSANEPATGTLTGIFGIVLLDSRSDRRLQ
jgi:membrane protein